MGVYYSLAVWRFKPILSAGLRFHSHLSGDLRLRNCRAVAGNHKFSSRFSVVQSLNSPFFPPPIEAEPGRAKEESRITCMRMLRTPPFFSPKSGEKPYLEVLSRFGLWRDFLNDNIQATLSAFRLIKNMSVNPRSVEFHQCHAILSHHQR